MPVLRITSLEDGMVLAKDAMDDRGNVVLRAGAVVNKAARDRLFLSRVRKVTVRGDTNVRKAANGATTIIGPNPDELPKKSETAIIQENLLKVAHMFNDYRDDRLMRELCRLAIKCAQERLISV